MASRSIRTLLFSKSPSTSPSTSPSSSFSTLLETKPDSNNHNNGEGEGASLLRKNKAHEINKKGGEGEFWGSSFNLASAAIGLGILSLRMLNLKE